MWKSRALLGLCLMVDWSGAEAVRRVVGSEERLVRRADSPVDVCSRWSHQSTVIGNKLYIYGGQVAMSSSQKDNRWNNNLIEITLDKDWSTGTPNIKGLPQPAMPPNGPPPVANGYLWDDGKILYQYGGIFSDAPDKEPTEFALWAYNTETGKWLDVTSETKVSGDSDTKEIGRVGEGAGATVPGRGLGFYFGGHLDYYTTKGWDKSIPRVYLKSLLEFDMNTKTFRNVTRDGLEKSGVPERADGVLAFVPWGKEGILVAIGGGNNETFAQMNLVDIYNLETKKWTKQSTDGEYPKYRVNPCAVVGSASDGSSHQIYFFGGQDLIPYGQQEQKNDMWILTIPAFTWIKVDQSKQSVPMARAGHSCNMVGRQIVVVGGYTGADIACDSPGIYVFDASSLEWATTYSAAAGGFSSGSSGDNKNGASKSSSSPYKVPKAVIDIVGGNGEGGARVTKPVKPADPDSPLFTGEPPQYKYTSYATIQTSLVTSTRADGSLVTSTAYQTTPVVRNGSSGGGGKTNIGAIVGGVVGGIALIVGLLFIGAYLLYRRKIKEIRAVAAMQAQSNGGGTKTSTEGSTSFVGGGSGQVDERFINKNGSSHDLLGEPTFWGVLLSPRRSLRVVNH